MTKEHSLISTLTIALEDGDERSTDQAISKVLTCVLEDDKSFGDVDVQKVNQLLRDHRQHEYMISYGEILGSEDRNTFNTDKHYAQALIDTGTPESALPLLNAMIRESDSRNSYTDFAEASGLIGRVHKDLYLIYKENNTDRASKHLNRSFIAYSKPWVRSPSDSVWHGVNLLAISSNALVNEFNIPNDISPDEIAESIIKTISNKKITDRDYWDWASLAEAQVWKEDWDSASEAIVSALDTGNAEPFHINGTLRQFKEMWCLQDRGEKPALLVTWLERNLIGQPNSELRLDAEDIDRQQAADEQQLQALHSHHRMRSGAWMKKFFLRSECVASIVNINSDEPIGTCSVIDGSVFSDEFEGRLLLLTNDHVISDFPDVYTVGRQPLRSEEAAVRFTQSADHDKKFPIARIIWSSPYQAHDVCLFEVDGTLPVENSTIPIVTHVPNVNLDTPEEVFLISHPEKDVVSFSFQNTDLIDHDTKATGKDSLVPGFIHYTTPSVPGSSGGIALNAGLEMIGLHHAGGSEINRLNGNEGTYAVNEAIWIQPIINAIRSDIAKGRSRWKAT
jgi:hypothetical protein